jgi:hypothetical protein
LLAKKNPITEAERSRRFVEKAKEIGADESTEGFDRVFEKMMPARRVASDPAKTSKDRKQE